MTCPHVLDRAKRVVPCSQCAGAVARRVPPPSPRELTAAERERIDRIVGRRDHRDDREDRPVSRRIRVDARQKAAWDAAGDTLEPVPPVPLGDLRKRELEIANGPQTNEYARARRRERAASREHAANIDHAAGDHSVGTTGLAASTSGTYFDTRTADHLPPCTAREGGDGAGVPSLDPEAT